MKKRTKEVLEILKEEYPDAKCELNYETPFQLLVATILSAQTTDKKVNEVTKGLFKDYPDVDSFLTISQEELEDRIKQIGLYRNKAKNLIILKFSFISYTFYHSILLLSRYFFYFLYFLFSLKLF